jgi:hypothetical protein
MKTNFPSEEWRPVPSVPDVFASSIGRVKGAVQTLPMPNGGIRQWGGKPTFGTLRDGRFVWSFRGKNFKVHRLVCEAFNGPCPPGLICCHEDEDGRNNRPGNLVWSTQKHNLNAPGFIAYCRSRTGDQHPRHRRSHAATVSL